MKRKIFELVEKIRVQRNIVEGKVTCPDNEIQLTTSKCGKRRKKIFV